MVQRQVQNEYGTVHGRTVLNDRATIMYGEL